MSQKSVSSAKRQALRQQGALNPHPQKVSDPLFQYSDFFDPQDLVQIKYEMLRRVEVEHHPVTHSATAFGFSRPTFYQAQSDFRQGGLAGLVPQKRGPRAAHKLTPEVLDFIRQQRATEPALDGTVLAERIQERFGVVIHPRSIERGVLRQGKKGP
jgi:transposase